MTKKIETYAGFEQGPIRPPSEAYSLLIRITRNCPWNRCRFCYIYKGTKFSIRPVDHVKRDIDTIHRYIEALSAVADSNGRIYGNDISRVAGKIQPDNIEAFNAAVHWMACGMQSIFLQDANSPVIKSAYLLEILRHLKDRFPWVNRITSYARSHTLARIKPDDLKEIGSAGLNRIHVGLETGSDVLLKLVNKGSSKENHIMAGLNVLNAGIELSEYIMPGLGGRQLSELHAIETADALNQINPHFIRLRTLLIPDGYPMFGDDPDVPFEKSTDVMIAGEIRQFIDHLDGITSTLASDHMNNLLQAVQGKLPDDKKHMISTIDAFLNLEPMDQIYFQTGRRFGFMVQTNDLKKPDKLERAKSICQQYGITPENADSLIDRLANRSL